MTPAIDLEYYEVCRTTQEQQAYRTALREATDAHLSRCQCQRTDCPRTV